MRRTLRPAIIPRLRAIALLLTVSACQGGEKGGNGGVELVIRSASGQRHLFSVELAVDETSQERGLMHRTALPDDRGMLFPFPVPVLASFWMKDTPLALDLIFIRPDGTIAAILEGKPNDLHPISAGEGVSAVLEIKGGRAKALGVSPGDYVQWGDCDGARPAPVVAWQADRFCPALPD